jgi:hypothetical protein
MSSINSGRNAFVQMCYGAIWGTKSGDAVVRIPISNESLEFSMNYSEADAFVGTSFLERMDIQSEHVEGGLDLYFTPDDIAYHLYNILGVELLPIELEAGVYKHYFLPTKSGSTKGLPFVDIEVEKLVDILRYVSLKANSLSISGSKEDYITGSVDFVGYEELKGEAMTEGLGVSQKQYFKFRRASIELDEDDAYDIDGFELSIDNNLQTDRYTAASKGKLSEIGAQGRSASLTLNTYLNTASYAMRTSKYLLGVTASVTLEFDVINVITGAVVFGFGMKMPKCYITEAPNQIDSADEQKIDLSLTVAEPSAANFAAASVIAGTSGYEADTIVGTSVGGLEQGKIVSFHDDNGDRRFVKYIGVTIAVGTGDLVFEDIVVAGAPSIMLAGGLFNEDFWEFQEAIVAWARDANDSVLEV